MIHLAAALWLLGSAEEADPYQIFARARQVWSQQRYPDYLTYVVAVNVTERGVDKAKHYHLAVDTSDGNIAVNPVSDEEAAAPPDPTGVTLHLQLKRQFRVAVQRRAGNPGEAVDYLGVPMVAPTYSFGMSLGDAQEAGQPDSEQLVAAIRKQYNDPEPAQNVDRHVTGNQIKTIAAVTSYVRRYNITLAGMDPVDGADCYHLLLQPTSDPQRWRLRQVWIDSQTFETRQLVSAGNFTDSKVPWLVRFSDVDGAEYIASETALAPVGVGDHRYERASIAFESIAQGTRPTGPPNLFVTKENLMQEPGGP